MGCVPSAHRGHSKITSAAPSSESEGAWAAQQAAGAASGWAALHQWLPVLRSQCSSAATKLLVLRSRLAPCMTYGTELWRPARNGANMTAVLTRAAKLICRIHRDALHMACFKDRSVNQDVMLADHDILSAADHGTRSSVCETGRFCGRRSDIRTQ